MTACELDDLCDLCLIEGIDNEMHETKSFTNETLSLQEKAKLTRIIISFSHFFQVKI